MPPNVRQKKHSGAYQPAHSSIAGSGKSKSDVLAFLRLVVVWCLFRIFAQISGYDIHMYKEV